MRLPSVTRLMAARLADTRKQAEEIRDALWNGQTSKANRLMDTCGIETIPWPANAFSECIVPDHTLEYFNAGDTYATTLLRIDGGSWFVGCWGDTFVACIRRFGKGGHE